MGKTKWSSEPEIPSTQPGQAPNAAPKRTAKRDYSPSRVVLETPDAPPIPVLLRQILVGLRRHWVAIRFQVNRLTGGLFRTHTVAKIGVLVLGAYIVLFRGEAGNTGAFAGRSIFGGTATETSLGIGTESGGQKPNWKSKNEAAPVSAGELTSDMTRDYIDRYSKVAIGEMQKYGVPASISLAQGLIESRAGTSKLAVRNNNHFGIKCFSRHCKTGHCSNFTDDTHKDFFRKFGNAWDSWRAHSQMISTGRYAKLKKYGRDYRQWAYGLKSVGYATDRTYAEKLIGVIDRYDLHKYDR